MKTIVLTKGMNAIVDDEDYAVLNKYKWCWGGHYAMRKVNRKKTVYMHRQLMGFPPRLEVDHINRNPLDNRKSNLRICDRAANERNKGIQRNNTSGFKGVSWNKASNKWMANIYRGKSYYLGLFTNPEKAYEHYLKAEKKFS